MLNAIENDYETPVVPNDDIYVELRIDNLTVYTTSTCPLY